MYKSSQKYTIPTLSGNGILLVFIICWGINAKSLPSRIILRFIAILKG